jgi:hypothetical protein
VLSKRIKNFSWAWWYMPIISALWRLRRGRGRGGRRGIGWELKVSLGYGYIVRPSYQREGKEKRGGMEGKRRGGEGRGKKNYSFSDLESH